MIPTQIKYSYIVSKLSTFITKLTIMRIVTMTESYFCCR